MTTNASLLKGHDRIETPRLSFTTLTPAHLPTLPWLDTALAPDWPLEALDPHIDAGNALLITDAAADPIGAVVVLLDTPRPASASIPLIAIDPVRRFRGLGADAVKAIETHLHANLAIDRVYAPIPDGRGLAVYFWLRLGYHPLLTSEAPWPLAGLTPEPRPGIWMLRNIADRGSPLGSGV